MGRIKVCGNRYRWKFMFFYTILALGSRDSADLAKAQENYQCPKTFFNFGTSLTDTGNLLNSLPFSPNVINFGDPENPPYGNSFFHRPAKRYSDGRLIPDFISLAFDVPLLDTYNAPTVFDFHHGVNFALDQVGVLERGRGVEFFLPLQIKQFIRFKSSALSAQSQRACMSWIPALPPRKNFRDALYMLEFGSSDLRSALQRGHSLTTIIGDIIPTIILNMINAVTILYQYEARNFLIYNVYPLGCSPQILTLLLDQNLAKDDMGCIVEINRLNEAYNSELFHRVQGLRANLPDASIQLFDFYNATMAILREPSKFGFDSSCTFTACCGASGVGSYNFNPNVTCGIDGSKSCEVPDRFVSWDGVHFTESFYRTISSFILTGEYITPSINYSQICNLNLTNFRSSATYDQVYGVLCNVWYS